jgi:UDP-2-acetamido-2-deoxy-ribo-hexuluronate aminotransferase
VNKIEFINLKEQQKKIKENVDKRIAKVLEHGNYIMGQEIDELEQKLSKYVGIKHCISCASGTDALLMPLMAYGVGRGDAIFTSTFTFIATAEVIALLGAVPVFVDVEDKTYNIDVNKLEEAIKKFEKNNNGLKMKCIIPVDIFGQPADYKEINSIAEKYGLFVIEDAAQSFGAEYKGKKACSLTDVGATSFFPAKPLGCYGDGGAIFTNDDDMAEKLKSIRVHGKGSDKYDNIRVGINGRLDTIQAAVLLAKMEIFDEEIKLRDKVAKKYSESLKDSVIVPYVANDRTSVWAQYSILSENRDEKIKKLKEKGIPTAIYYPKPLHLQQAFAYLGYKKGDFPVSEKISDKVFSIPMHPYLKEDEQKYIIDAMK